MSASEKLLLFALEAARPEQVDAPLALLAELIDEAVNSWLTKELEEL
jgi:hypothetical protein